MLGYADESGEPGIKKNEHDYFLFCIVLLDNKEQALEIDERIAVFREDNLLSDTHEFHYATDSKRIRARFASLVSRLDFRFVSISIKKDNYQKTASFGNMSTYIMDVLERNGFDVKIIMDTNPRLKKELCSKKKNYKVDVRFSEKKSRGNSLIQVADYVTAIKARYLKNSSKKGVKQMYSRIMGKLVDEIRV